MMALPVDSAGIEVVPLEALPSEIASDLGEPAASPGTASGDSESVSEPQSTEESTATVGPEASAISLTHDQHNLVRRLTTKKSELFIIIIGTFITLAGLVLSFRAYSLTKEANELTRKGNAVAENAYKLQLWDDCHDRQDLQNSSLCRSDSSLIRRDAGFGKLQHIYGKLNDMVSLSGLAISYSSYSSISLTASNSHPTAAILGSGKHSIPGPVDLWHWVGSALMNIFLSLVFYHLLFVLRDVLFRLIGAEKRKKPLSYMYGLWVYVFTLQQFFLASLSSLYTGLDRDRSYTLALAIPFVLYVVIER